MYSKSTVAYVNVDLWGNNISKEGAIPLLVLRKGVSEILSSKGVLWSFHIFTKISTYAQS